MSNDVDVSDLSISRSQFRIKNRIDGIKEECGELQDTDEVMRCMNAAEGLDKEMDEIFRDNDLPETSGGKTSKSLSSIIEDA